MYLSKVWLHWDTIVNPYEAHRALWKIFPEQKDKKRAFLFRTEKQIKRQGAQVLMLSDEEPGELTSMAKVLASKIWLPHFEAGMQLRFRIRANPVKKILDAKGRTKMHSPDEIKPCRVPLIRQDEQQAWLARKLAPGATLQSILIQQELPLYFHKKGMVVEPGNARNKIQPVLFDGLLTVDNPEAFISLLRQGIGPAKAFGCGLLSLAPA